MTASGCAAAWAAIASISCTTWCADRVRVVEQVHPDERGDLVVAAAARAQRASELGADGLDERAFEGAVHVLVAPAWRRARRTRCAGSTHVQPLVHRRLVGRRQVTRRRRAPWRARAIRRCRRARAPSRSASTVESAASSGEGPSANRPPQRPSAMALPRHFRVPPRADLRRQRPELDEALGQRLVERVAGVVGREGEVVQALARSAAR